MKTMRKSFSLLLALLMSLSLMNSALAAEPSGKVWYVNGLRIESIDGPFIEPRSYGHNFYNGYEVRNDREYSPLTFTCLEEYGPELYITVDNSIGDVPIRVKVYYDVFHAETYTLEAQTEGPGSNQISHTTRISAPEGEYLNGSGIVYLEPMEDGGNSVFWVTIRQHF